MDVFTSIKLRTLLLLSAIMITQVLSAQVDQKANPQTKYKDVVYDGAHLWTLTSTGTLNLLDPSTGARASTVAIPNTIVTTIATDKQGAVVVGTADSTIRQYNKKTKSWTTLFHFNNVLTGIVFDSKNHCYLVTNKGVYDPVVDKYFYADTKYDLRRGKHEWTRSPAFSVDQHDNIWLGFNYGEWGGEIFVFDTKKKMSVTSELRGERVGLYSIQSIFGAGKKLFVISRGSLGGQIAAYEGFSGRYIFESYAYQKFPADSTTDGYVEAEYIGKGTYNKWDSCIYFYSQNGIFKGNPDHDLSKIEHWEKILQPILHDADGQVQTGYSPANISKLMFIDPKKFIFVTSNDGIGIYDGKHLIMTQ